MNRFTERDRNGKARLVLKNANECMGEDVKRWSVSTSSNGTVTITGEAVEKFAYYEELEESGCLLELPCPEGAYVWKIIKQRDNFDDSTYKIVTQVEFRLDMLKEIGKTVFLTKYEAKQALRSQNNRE